MSQKKNKPEKIVAKLRQVDVLPFARSLNSRRTCDQQNASVTPSPAATSVL
ncbi:hypothetical protein AAFN86_28485 [Roseomonas sp. CAU 1739]